MRSTPAPGSPLPGRPQRGIGWAVIAVALAIPAAFPASRADISGLFAGGNAAYQRGDYQSAERSYRSILSEGIDSVAVYYNLANACFKQKKLGEAVYFWETARRRAPRDLDILGNLEFAAQHVVDKIEAPVEPWPIRAWHAAVDLISPGLESWLLAVFFFAANAFFGWYVIARSRRTALTALFAAAAMLCVVLALATSLAWMGWDRHQRREAVILESRADAHSGPGDENVTVFSVHEGTVVRIRSGASGWQQVSLPNGWNGWIRSSAVREIR